MNFESLPTDAASILALQWADYEPYYRDLEERDLTVDNIDEWLDNWSTLAATVDEQYWRLEIGTTVNTADKEVEESYAKYVQEIQPLAKTSEQKLKKKLLDSGLSPKSFESATQRFRAETDVFTEESLPFLGEEKKLNVEYNKVVGSMTVTWDGEEKTMSDILALLFHPDRNVRERAWHLRHERRAKEWKVVGGLWERFVPLRMEIAEKAGMPDYISYIWKKRFRFDYTPDDCKSFHAAIEEVAVPAAKLLYEKRRQRLGVDSLRPWDFYVDPLGSDELTPHTSIEDFKSKTRTVFQKVDPELGEYFQTMVDEGLLDLENRKNKAPGAYSLGMHATHRPFVFMSAMNNHWDVSTILHEGGHAFHEFERAHLNFYQRGEIYLPAEFAEVASMSMELLASPYITKEHGGYYTEQDAARALIGQHELNMFYWPYMALVDAFQHWVYENPKEGSDVSACNDKWGEMWDRFMPGIDYSGLEPAKKTYWYWQSHIHTDPFYYIEYALAQLGAAQVFGNARKDQKKAVMDYRKALAFGASVTLPDLFKTAGAKFAFDINTVKHAVDLTMNVINELEEKL